MKKETTDELKKAAEIELAGQKCIKNKLLVIRKSLLKTVNRQKQEREARSEMLEEYQTEEDIAEAYGYGNISDEERSTLLAALEKKEKYLEEFSTPESFALEWVNERLSKVNRLINALKWELLSPEKQEEIRQREEERKRRKEELCQSV